MRRPLAFLTALAVGLTGLALLQSASLADVATGPALVPPTNQTAVKGGDRVSLSGSTDPAASLLGARMVWIAAPGAPGSEELDSYELSDLQLSGGSFSGQTVLPSAPIGSNDGGVLFEATLDVSGSQRVLRSNVIPVDLERPYILKTELVAGDRVQATFSEPVFIHEPQEGADLVTDWAVDGYNPTQITGSGAVRNLSVLPVQQGQTAYDEDATPQVKYIAGTVPAKGWFFYVDRAGNIRAAENSYTTAIDKIAPAVPSLAQVAGLANDSVAAVVANDRTPTARLTGLRPGHVGQLYVESSVPEGLQADGDALLGEAVAGDDGVALVEIDEDFADSEDYPLDADGRYTLYGAARDRAKCWPSDGPESAECPNLSDTDLAFYELDTVAPKALYGLVTGTTQVEVNFTEYLHPDGGEAAQWQTSLGGNVTGVSGQAAAEKKRTLTVDGILPGITDVSWDPAAGTFGAYRDLAGNLLESFTLTATDALPPLVNVTLPTGRVVTSSLDLFRIGGTATNAQLVKVYRRLDDNSIQFVSEVNVLADQTWSANVPLLPNAENRLMVRGFRLAAEAQILGPEFDVPTIVQDAIAPQLGDIDVHPRTLHNGQQGFKGGDATEITWTAGDANFLPSPFVVELSVDGGQTWRMLTTAIARTERSYAWAIERDTTDNALIRVTAVDEAGWITRQTSPLFVIDSTLPHFTPKTLNANQVIVEFSEPVATDADEINRFEWRVAGTLVQDAQPQTNDADDTMMDAVLLTLLPTYVIAPNDTPCVAYVPVEAVLEDSTCGANAPSAPMPQFKKGFTDRADNAIEDTKLLAIDNIDPLGPTVAALPSLTGATQLTIAGSAEKDPTNKAIAKRSDGRAFAGGIGPNGSFSIPVELIRDVDTTFQVYIVDPASNLSGSQAVHSENDGTSPQVKVKKLQQRRSGARRIIRIRWTSVDKHRATADILFRVGNRRLLRIAKATPDDGSYVWRVPRHLTGKRLRVLVQATDLVGNRSQAYSPRLRVR